MKHRCPICKKIVEVPHQKQSKDVENLPFCSQRCKLVDLGAWLDAEYRVVSGPTDNFPDATTDETRPLQKGLDKQ